jgi:hypothetical protein
MCFQPDRGIRSGFPPPTTVPAMRWSRLATVIVAFLAGAFAVIGCSDPPPPPSGKVDESQKKSPDYDPDLHSNSGKASRSKKSASEYDPDLESASGKASQSKSSPDGGSDPDAKGGKAGRK